MNAPKNEKKVIWAVDPFSEDKKLQFRTLKALTVLTAKTGEWIEPVAVLSPDQLKVPAKAFSAQSKEYHLEAEAILEKWVKESKHKRLLKPKLLAQNEFSGKSSVKAILEYAKATGIRLIGLGTRSRKGVQRFFIGSFCENLMLHSSLPLLVVGDRVLKFDRVAKIFFPTDFSDSSRVAFERLLPLAGQHKAKVVLYYKVEYVLPETIYSIHSTPVYGEYLSTEISARRKKGEEWIGQAQAHGVKAELLLDEKPGYVPGSILKVAKKEKASLIAMGSHTGPIAAIFIGSITREVVRGASNPVWVLHP